MSWMVNGKFEPVVRGRSHGPVARALVLHLRSGLFPSPVPRPGPAVPLNPLRVAAAPGRYILCQPGESRPFTAAPGPGHGFARPPGLGHVLMEMTWRGDGVMWEWLRWVKSMAGNAVGGEVDRGLVLAELLTRSCELLVMFDRRW